MTVASKKCQICKLTCWDRQNVVKCEICNSVRHKRCLENNLPPSTLNSYRNFLCASCVNDNLPFQNMDNESFFNEIENISLETFLKNINDKNENFFDEWHDNGITDKYFFQEDLSYSLNHVNGQLSILHINIVSLIANFDRLEELLLTLNNSPDVIHISETRLKHYHNNSFIPSLENYDFYRKDSKTAAGGVGIFVKSHLDVTVKEELSLNVDECEDMWLNIKLPNHKQFVTAAIYRHPRHNFEKFQYAFVNSIEKLNKNNTKFYIFGDFNINLLQYQNDSKIKLYVDLLNCYDCRYLLTKPTRINKSKIQRSSLLDHIYTNDCKYELNPGILVSDTSDHFPTFLQIDMRSQNNFNKIQKCRDMKNFNNDNFLKNLENELNNIKNTMNNNVNYDINETFDALTKTIKNSVDKHAPIRNKTRAEKRITDKTWLTKGILVSIKDRKKYTSNRKKISDLKLNTYDIVTW